jgi:glyoxylase-like metal-dependent hydrolase (beta-lactamase superfamily II)
MKELMLEVSEELPEIFFIPGQREGKYPYSHSLLINDTLIDTGISSGYVRKLKRKTPIKRVILSHWHEDHISGNRILPDVEYIAHPEDIPIIEDVSKMYEYYHVDENSPQRDLFDTILQGLRLESVSVDTSFSDNKFIEINDRYELNVIHTPGHTKGHCCFYEKKAKLAFLGDIDLSGLGPWYGGIDSDVMEFEESINKIRNLDIEIAISGHKGVFYNSKEIQVKLQKFQNKIYERDEKILQLLSESKPKTSEDLSKKNIVYPRYSEYKIYEILAERIMIESHLNKFLKEEKIEKSNGGYVLS